MLGEVVHQVRFGLPGAQAFHFPQTSNHGHGGGGVSPCQEKQAGSPGDARSRESSAGSSRGCRGAAPARINSHLEESRSQEPPPPEAGGGVDRISGLPDEILGEIASFLSTKGAARTQTLSSRWCHVWRAAPLVLDGIELASKDLPAGERFLDASDGDIAGVVSLILSAHPGPGRRFCIPPRHLHYRPDTVDEWLRSPALDNLQELDFCDFWHVRPFPPAPPPASAFRFTATLQVATFTKFEFLDSSVEGIHFPQLKQLALQQVTISEGSLHSMISSCPILECLLLKLSFGFTCVRISSSNLKSIGLGASYYGNCIDKPNLRLRELIIVDAPCLERLLFLSRYMEINVSVIAAPKLETLGCLSDKLHDSRLVFGTTTIQGYQVTKLTAVVNNVRILAMKLPRINLDMVIDLLKCFPCLEKLYIKGK
ncbi:unnamed protein product [Urochloa decumbens]|uniref:F-box domain-containing protein n=1 Tax=Urochloa decumbens TaxID=240449 RepID=A0ABC9FP60_9POAL